MASGGHADWSSVNEAVEQRLAAWDTAHPEATFVEMELAVEPDLAALRQT
jgi:hypothetical protein